MPSSHSTPRANRSAAIVKFIAFIVGGLFFVWNLLVVYAFSSMVNPELPSDQRTAEIFRRFLFGESIAHIIMVTGLIAATLMCFALASINAWTLISKTNLEYQLSNISTATLALAIVIVGLTYCFLA